MVAWREVITVHPAADLFPLLYWRQDEFRALADDIKANGLHEKIKVIEKRRRQPDDGTHHLGDFEQIVLDGRNRLDAMELAGLPIFSRGTTELDPDIVEIVPDETDPVAYVIGVNIRRRHLTGEQKRELIGKLLKTNPERSNRQTAALVQVDDKTVGSVRRDMEGRAEIPHVAKTVDTKGRQQPTSKPKSAPVELEPPSVELAIDEDGGVPFVPLVPMSERIKLTRLVFPLLRYVYDKQKAPDWQQTIKDIGADRFGDIVETMRRALELVQPSTAPKTEADKAKAEAL
jgi:hypothetical protein